MRGIFGVIRSFAGGEISRCRTLPPTIFEVLQSFQFGDSLYKLHSMFLVLDNKYHFTCSELNDIIQK